MDIKTEIKLCGNISDNEKSEMNKLVSDIEFLCRTPIGSLPLMRGFGIDYDAVDCSFTEARRRIMISATEGIRKYFGITVSDINVTADESGTMVIHIEI